MSVGTMLRHRCDVARNAAVGTNGRKTMQTVASSIPCMVTPMSDQQAVSGSYTVGQTYTMFFNPTADIQRGDRVTFNGNTYLIKGLKPYMVFGGVSFVQAVAETEQANG